MPDPMVEFEAVYFKKGTAQNKPKLSGLGTHVSVPSIICALYLGESGDGFSHY